MNARKFLALTLALALCLGLLPMPTLAAGPLTAGDSGTWGDNVTWTVTENEDVLDGILDGKKGLTLTFTGRGKMIDCESKPEATPWSGNWQITRIEINAGITNVPSHLCGNDWGGTLINLTTVYLSATVGEIGDAAFYGCDKIKEIHIPGSVKAIGDYAFIWCDGLTEITVEASNRNYQAVNGVLFSKGENAELICYPPAKADTSYTVPDGIRKISNNAFAKNKFLETIVLPDSLVEIDGAAFTGCAALKHINLPNSLTAIGPCAFDGCAALEHIDLPISIETIPDGAFAGTALTSITIPEGVKTIEGVAFAFCENLTQIQLPSTLCSVDPSAFWTYSAPGQTLDIIIPASVTSFRESYDIADAMIGEKHNDVIFRFQGNAPSDFCLAGGYYDDAETARTTIYYLASASGWDAIKQQEWAKDIIFCPVGGSNPKPDDPKPTPAESKLTLSKSAVSVQAGQTTRVTATVSGPEDKNIYAISADASVATVSVSDKAITVKGVAEGNTSVYVIMSDAKTVTLADVKADPSMQEIKVTVTAPSGSSGGGGSRPSYSSGGGGGATTTQPTQAGTPASELFTDVVKDSWYESGVTYVVNKGLFKGMSEKIFSPHTNMTRAMVMTVLARMDGQDTANATNGPWYTNIMNWAVAKGISDGTAPESNVTREQLVTMLYRYAKANAAAGDLTGFVDGASVSPYAREAIVWAVKQGILTGKDGSRLDPQGTATRAEVATIFRRFVENK